MILTMKQQFQVISYSATVTQCNYLPFVKSTYIAHLQENYSISAEKKSFQVDAESACRIPRQHTEVTDPEEDGYSRWMDQPSKSVRMYCVHNLSIVWTWASQLNMHSQHLQAIRLIILNTVKNLQRNHKTIKN